MNTLLAVFSMILGFIVGSFLNVVIYRLNTKKTLGGRSMCLSCGHTIQWYDLIPVFSYLALKGRCRNCQSHISVQYPLVEVGMGVLLGLLFYKLSPLFYIDFASFITNYIYYGSLFALLVIITVYDIRHKIIPDGLSLLFGILAFAGLFCLEAGFISPRIPDWIDLASGFALSLPFAILWLVSSGRWMGLGDAKLAVGLGFMLGINLLVPATLIAFWAGALYGMMLIALRKAGPRTEIPFAPFLVLGTLVTFIFNLSLDNLLF